MEIIFTLCGIIMGMIISYIFYNKKNDGIIEIDHATKLCRIKICSKDLENPKSKKAVFIIDHTAKIRDENSFYNE